MQRGPRNALQNIMLATKPEANMSVGSSMQMESILKGAFVTTYKGYSLTTQ